MAATKRIYSETQNDYRSCGGVRYRGQTFTTTDAFSLTKVVMTLSVAGGTEATVYCDIFATSGGVPTGSSLAQGSVANTVIPDTAGQVEFTMGTPYNVAASTMYAIVMSSPAGADGWFRVYDIESGSVYAGGTVISKDVPAAWSTASASDEWFQVWGEDIVVVTTVTVTQTAKGRIKQEGLSGLETTKARLKQLGITVKTTSKARIKSLGTSKLITERARLKQFGVVKGVTSKARVKQISLSKLVTSKARLKQSANTKKTTLKSRIKQIGNTVKETSRARVKTIGTSKLTTLKARVKQSGNVKNTTSRARVKIANITDKITTKARLKQADNTKKVTSKARLKQFGTSKTISGKGRVKGVDITKVITSKARLKQSGLLKVITSRARLKQSSTGNLFTSKANIVDVGKTYLYLPTTGSSDNSPITFEWYIPSNKWGKNLNFNLQVDKTDDTFADLELNKNSYQDSGFEYFNGATWEAIPTSGVENTYAGNLARYSSVLTSGKKYWRVQAFAG